jgi:hypothetical protein
MKRCIGKFNVTYEMLQLNNLEKLIYILDALQFVPLNIVYHDKYMEYIGISIGFESFELNDFINKNLKSFSDYILTHANDIPYYKFKLEKNMLEIIKINKEKN